MTPRLESARIRLRAPVEADVPRIVEALGDWCVAQWLQRPPYPYHEADARAFLAQPPASPPDRWTVTAAGDDRLLGMLTLETAPGGREAGYWLHPDAWGRGLMAEALGLAVTWMAQREPQGTVWAIIDPENGASRRVLERCGFRRTESWRLAAPGRRGTFDREKFARQPRDGGNGR